MLLPDFFYSKKFKVIITTILTVELLVILVLKIYSCFCVEPGCWNKKACGTDYCMDHINSNYEEYKKNHPVEKHNKNSYNSRSYSSGKKKSTPSYSTNTYNYNDSRSTNRNDSYDVYDYDDPDEFADDWAEEFGDGDYDSGYDDAYDYWEETH